jgi:hypothetical protein
MSNHHTAMLNFLRMLPVFVLPLAASAQIDNQKKTQLTLAKIEVRSNSETDAAEAQRRAFAFSLVTSLADEARAYRDLALRPRVLARAADAIWDADNDTARGLFRRAWQAAEVGDADELTVKTKDDPPPVVTALRRMSGRDLRSEVLNMAAKRDRALGEEFLVKLQDETERAAADSKEQTNSPGVNDNWSASGIAAKRLQLARTLLDDNQTEQAIEFAAPSLNQVNLYSIGFLSALRRKKPDTADQMFASLLARAEFDPLSDANTVSGLSSYVISPGLYVIFKSDGSARWSQSDEPAPPPNLSAPLRNKFLQASASILLKPPPAADQDFTSSGPIGKSMVVKRLLPLFDQYAHDTATALRTELTTLAGPSTNTPDHDGFMLARGNQPEENTGDALEQLQDRLSRATNSRERDRFCADTAVALANQGDLRAQDVAGKIEDPDRRLQVRRYVDLGLIQRAARKGDASEIVRLSKTGQLSHVQRAMAYSQAGGLLLKAERGRALEYLQEAVDEARRAEADDPERPRVLIAIATQYLAADRVRAWEIMDDAVRAANSTEKFRGGNEQLRYGVASTNGVNFVSIGPDDYSLAGVLRMLGKDDFYRSIDLAKSFKNDEPRATATLAIARAVLDKTTRSTVRP